MPPRHHFQLMVENAKQPRRRALHRAGRVAQHCGDALLLQNTLEGVSSAYFGGALAGGFNAARNNQPSFESALNHSDRFAGVVKDDPLLFGKIATLGLIVIVMDPGSLLALLFLFEGVPAIGGCLVI